MVWDVSSVGVPRTNRSLWSLQRGCDHVISGLPTKSPFVTPFVRNSTPTPIISKTADANMLPIIASAAFSWFIFAGGVITGLLILSGASLSISGIPHGP